MQANARAGEPSSTYHPALRAALLAASLALGACSLGADDDMAELVEYVASIQPSSDYARDVSVGGPDRNVNGVRDDIDEFIDSTDDSFKQKEALRQQASAIRRSLGADVKSEGAIMSAAKRISDARSCIDSRYDASRARSRWREILRASVNTPNRLEAYQRFQKAISGKNYGKSTGESCLG